MSSAVALTVGAGCVRTASPTLSRLGLCLSENPRPRPPNAGVTSRTMASFSRCMTSTADAFIDTNSAGRAVILGGDTNLHTESNHPDASGGADTEIWRTFRERTGLTDACTATDCPDVTSIDKIAYRSSDSVQLTATSHAMPRDRFTAPEGEALSDHPPVVVEFTWKKRR